MGIGIQLKDARETKGLTLEELQASTKIQKRYLQAIEEENFGILPGSFYARAFIKEYAGAVGLDSQELLEEYESEIPKPEEDDTPQYTQIQRSRKGSSPEKSSAIFSIIPTIIVALLVIGVLFAGWYFLKQNVLDDSPTDNVEESGDNEVYRGEGDSGTDSNNNKSSQEDANNNNTTGNDDQNGAKNDTESNEETKSDDEPDKPDLVLLEDTTTGGQATSEFELKNPDEKVTVTFEASDRTWLTVQGSDDDNIYYDFFGEEDSPLELDVSNEKDIYVKIGHAPSVSIKVNGIELDYPNDPDEYDVQSVIINFN